MWLGNANVLLVAAIAWAAVGPPRWTSGVALGLAAAVFAKPLLIPVLLWLLVVRRPVVAGTVATALVATAAGLVVAGPSAYVAWFGALLAGNDQFTSGFLGNHGVSAFAPGLWVPVAVLVLVAYLLVLLRRGPAISLCWAVTVGILAAPYAGTYSALPVALALPVLAPALPAVAILLVGVSPMGTTLLLPFWAGAVLVAALAVRDEARATGWSLRTL